MSNDQPKNPEGLLDEDLWDAMLVTLRKTRTSRRIPMRTLAQDIGVHYSHLSRMENNKVIPSVTLAFRWCRALGLDFDALYRFSAKPDPGCPGIG